MVITFFTLFELFQAFPADMSFTISTLYVIASSIFLYASLASWALLYSKIFHMFLNVVSILPLTAGIVRMRLVTFEALCSSAGFTVYYTLFLDLTL